MESNYPNTIDAKVGNLQTMTKHIKRDFNDGYLIFVPIKAIEDDPRLLYKILSNSPNIIGDMGTLPALKGFSYPSEICDVNVYTLKSERNNSAIIHESLPIALNAFILHGGQHLNIRKMYDRVTHEALTTEEDVKVEAGADPPAIESLLNYMRISAKDSNLSPWFENSVPTENIFENCPTTRQCLQVLLSEPLDDYLVYIVGSDLLMTYLALNHVKSEKASEVLINKKSFDKFGAIFGGIDGVKAFSVTTPSNVMYRKKAGTATQQQESQQQKNNMMEIIYNFMKLTDGGEYVPLQSPGLFYQCLTYIANIYNVIEGKQILNPTLMLDILTSQLTKSTANYEYWLNVEMNNEDGPLSLANKQAIHANKALSLLYSTVRIDQVDNVMYPEEDFADPVKAKHLLENLIVKRTRQALLTVFNDDSVLRNRNGTVREQPNYFKEELDKTDTEEPSIDDLKKQALSLLTANPPASTLEVVYSSNWAEFRETHIPQAVRFDIAWLSEILSSITAANHFTEKLFDKNDGKCEFCSSDAAATTTCPADVVRMIRPLPEQYKRKKPPPKTKVGCSLLLNVKRTATDIFGTMGIKMGEKVVPVSKAMQGRNSLSSVLNDDDDDDDDDDDIRNKMKKHAHSLIGKIEEWIKSTIVSLKQEIFQNEQHQQTMTDPEELSRKLGKVAFSIHPKRAFDPSCYLPTAASLKGMVNEMALMDAFKTTSCNLNVINSIDMKCLADVTASSGIFIGFATPKNDDDHEQTWPNHLPVISFEEIGQHKLKHTIDPLELRFQKAAAVKVNTRTFVNNDNIETRQKLVDEMRAHAMTTADVVDWVSDELKNSKLNSSIETGLFSFLATGLLKKFQSYGCISTSHSVKKPLALQCLRTVLKESADELNAMKLLVWLNDVAFPSLTAQTTDLEEAETRITTLLYLFYSNATVPFFVNPKPAHGFLFPPRKQGQSLSDVFKFCNRLVAKQYPDSYFNSTRCSVMIPQRRICYPAKERNNDSRFIVSRVKNIYRETSKVIDDLVLYNGSSVPFIGQRPYMLFVLPNDFGEKKPAALSPAQIATRYGEYSAEVKQMLKTDIFANCVSVDDVMNEKSAVQFLLAHFQFDDEEEMKSYVDDILHDRTRDLNEFLSDDVMYQPENKKKRLF